MKIIKVELTDEQLKEIMYALEVATKSFQFMTHNQKFTTETEISRMNLITLTYELLLSYRIKLDKSETKKSEKNYKKIS